jgi:hypothetical protein
MVVQNIINKNIININIKKLHKMLKNIVIYGERCSGTNYLEELLLLNFQVQRIKNKFNSKHFFGFHSYEDTDDILFICIVRGPHEWFNSLFRQPYHLPYLLRGNIHNFLNNEIFSFDDYNYPDKYETREIMEDRNIYTKERYKNIFELRHTKLKFLVEDLPKKVKNFILIRYEDLIWNFGNTMNKIKNCNLEVNENINFPVNTNNYKQNPNINFLTKKKDPKIIPGKIIYGNPNFNPQYEIRLGYYPHPQKEYEDVE